MVTVLLPCWYNNLLHTGHNRPSARRCRLCTIPQDIDDKIQHLEERKFLRHIQNSRRGNRVCLLMIDCPIKTIQLGTLYMQYFLACRFGIVPRDKSHTHYLLSDIDPLRNLVHKIGGRHYPNRLALLGTPRGISGSTPFRYPPDNTLLGIVCMLHRLGVYRLDTRSSIVLYLYIRLPSLRLHNHRGKFRILIGPLLHNVQLDIRKHYLHDPERYICIRGLWFEHHTHIYSLNKFLHHQRDHQTHLIQAHIDKFLHFQFRRLQTYI